MSIPIFLFSIIIFVIWLQVRLRKIKPFSDVIQEYLDEERNLNFSPKKEISEEYFVKPDINRLPINKTYPGDLNNRLALKADYAINKSQLPMIKFKVPKGNRELKSEFGIANLNLIVDYEENFNSFARALIDWVQLLIENGSFADAEQILRESIRLGSDFIKNFTLLADIYAETDPEKLNALIDEIQNSELSENNPHTKEKSLEYIKRLLEA